MVVLELGVALFSLSLSQTITSDRPNADQFAVENFLKGFFQRLRDLCQSLFKIGRWRQYFFNCSVAFLKRINIICLFLFKRSVRFGLKIHNVCILRWFFFVFFRNHFRRFCESFYRETFGEVFRFMFFANLNGHMVRYFFSFYTRLLSQPFDVFKNRQQAFFFTSCGRLLKA